FLMEKSGSSEEMTTVRGLKNFTPMTERVGLPQLFQVGPKEAVWSVTILTIIYGWSGVITGPAGRPT
ncbi:MAG: hypothetical protein QGF55_09135, partial [SAR324 cluster bacterium]|nr:hypothetical protein [SAR324 cluster bacterium]